MMKANKKDYVWSYLSFIVRYGSMLVLTPFAIAFLPNQELGLWYSFASVTAIVILLDFGFSKTFVRNITFAWSGAEKLVKHGVSTSLSTLNGPNYKLFSSVFIACRYLSFLIASIAFVLMMTLGTWYVSYIMKDYPDSYTLEWTVYAIAVFLNLFYGYWTSVLSGIGKIEKAQKAITLSTMVQVPISVVGLYFGYGLMAMSIGYLAGGITMLLAAKKYLNESVDKNLYELEKNKTTKKDVAEVVNIIWFNSKKLGIGMLALTIIHQSSTFICSMVIGVDQTASYGLANQLIAIIIAVANVFHNTNIPAFSSMKLLGKKHEMKKMYSFSVFMYWLVSLTGLLGLVTVGMKVLSILKPEHNISIALIVFLGIVHIMEGNFIMNCNIIAASNEIPYMRSFVYTSIVLVGLSLILTIPLNMGVYGLIIAKAAAELMYIGWKWPKYIMNDLDVSPKYIVVTSMSECKNFMKKMDKARKSRKAS